MIEPSDCDIGRRVVYTGNRHPGGKLEEGVITSFNAHTVFVRYGTRTGSQGTARADLEWGAVECGCPSCQRMRAMRGER